MADFDYESLEDLTLTMESEDGEEIELELLTIFEYEDVDYGAFTELNSTENIVYFFSLQFGETRGEETEVTFECVEDETLGETLLGIFQEVIDSDLDTEEEIEFAQAMDEEEIQEDESQWDKFINKKIED
ncbi:MAG: DUF1292 domain-containing protein [Eubacterium sp.]|nr:DUF1292 domain-containing protein [Eubacterium sp.]